MSFHLKKLVDGHLGLKKKMPSRGVLGTLWNINLETSGDHP